MRHRFLLAKLHIDSLIGTGTVRALRNTLKSLPAGSDAYDSTYRYAMKRIQGQIPGQVQMAQKVLSWITCAKQPLTITELQHALAVEVDMPYLDEENLPDPEDIISSCAGLVTVDRQSHIIRWIHYTTQEYFERSWTDWFPNAHQRAADICIAYLSYSAFETGMCNTYEDYAIRLSDYPLFKYATQFWGVHYRAQQADEQSCLRLLQTSTKVGACSQGLVSESRHPSIHQPRSWGSRNMTGLHLAAYFGLDRVAQKLIDEKMPVDAENENGETPLSLAARSGHDTVLKILLDQGVQVNIRHRAGKTPLICAIENGHQSVAQLLLEKGAKPNLKDINGQTPLNLAANKGEQLLVEALLEKGAEVNLQSFHNGRTPLFPASIRGDYAVVKLLLLKGAEINIRDYDYNTPLFLASASGDDTMVRFLLANGADPNLRSKHGQMPLTVASIQGYAPIVRLLLEKGAKQIHKDVLGRTPLAYALSDNNEAVIKLLQENGAEPIQHHQ